MSRKLVLLIAVLLAAAPGLALADGPVNLALVPDVQIVGQSESVTALRVGIWSRNANMTGLDIGIVSQNSGAFTGLQWSAAGIVDGDFTGWQNTWLAAVSNGNMQGLQTAFYTHAGVGSTGVQFGLINTADEFSGLQLGFVNITQAMRSGLQIGLINVIQNKEKLKLFPIVNWKF